jgi:hypothetical protein
MKKLSTLMICLFLISTSVFGQKNRNQKTYNSTITTNEIDRIKTKLIENRQCSRFEFGILNNKKSFIQKHMVIRIKRK